MRSLNWEELLAITGTNKEMLKSLRRRKALALAWGRGQVYEGLRYLPLDAVGMLLVRDLGKNYSSKGEKGYEEVAAILRAHSDIWARVVAEAERDYLTHQRFLVRFCIVDFERNSDRKRAHLVGGSRDTSDEAIARAMAQSPQAKDYIPTRITCANVSHLLEEIRSNAEEHGIKLHMPFTFMPHPESREFAELMRPFEQAKANAIIEVQNRKKREAEVRKIGERVRARAMAAFATSAQSALGTVD
jgi:hypothetical protein